LGPDTNQEQRKGNDAEETPGTPSPLGNERGPAQKTNREAGDTNQKSLKAKKGKGRASHGGETKFKGGKKIMGDKKKKKPNNGSNSHGERMRTRKKFEKGGKREGRGRKIWVSASSIKTQH